MWLTIDLYRQGRVDLLVRRRGRVVRVPDCYWHKTAGRFVTQHLDHRGRSRLRPGDVPIYFMQVEWPHAVDHYRRK